MNAQTVNEDTPMQTEALCDTVSKPIPVRHLYWCLGFGMVLFGGTALWMGRGFFPKSLLMGGAWMGAALLGGVLLLPPLVCLHEAAHWAAFRAFGAKTARFFWVMRNGKPVAPSVAAPGKWLWRWQYALVIIAPTIVVSTVGVALMAALPVLHGALVVALTLHLAGCVNDWEVFGSTVALPRGTRIEDRENGFAYRTP